MSQTRKTTAKWALRGACPREGPMKPLPCSHCFILKTAVGGEVFLTQRRRDAENAEKIENLGFYRSDLNNLLFHPLGDVLLQRNLMHSSSYSQNSRQSLRSQPLCGSA